jgi:hypothetical protein
VSNLAPLNKIRRRNADNSGRSAVVNNWTPRSANKIVISHGKINNLLFSSNIRSGIKPKRINKEKKYGKNAKGEKFIQNFYRKPSYMGDITGQL